MPKISELPLREPTGGEEAPVRVNNKTYRMKIGNAFVKEVTSDFEIPTSYLGHNFITILAKSVPVTITTEGAEQIGSEDGKTITEIDGVLFLQVNENKDGYNIIQYTG